MKKKRMLVIEPHSDDSIISAGAFLEKSSAQYDYWFILVAASDIDFHHAGLLTREMRIAEYKAYVAHFGGNWVSDHGFPFDEESRLDMCPRARLVSSIERAIADVRPDTMLVQGPSFHHDHVAVYEAAIAATRPTAKFYPEEILIMENPTYVHSPYADYDFKPNVFVSCTEDMIDRKLELFASLFPSQIRTDENYLSAKGIKDWARYRGIEGRCQYAEAFRLYSRIQ